MQSDKNMVCRLGQAIILSSVLTCTSCGAGVNQKNENSKSWSLHEDADYFVSRPERGSVEYSVILVAAQATIGIKEYGSVAEKISAESAHCLSWVVFQEIDVGNGQIDGTLLCKKGVGQWRSRRFGYTGDATYYGPLGGEFDQKKASQLVLGLSQPKIDFKNYTVLDDSALLITKYDGNLARSAIYAPAQFSDVSRDVSSLNNWSFSSVYAFLRTLDNKQKKK